MKKKKYIFLEDSGKDGWRNLESHYFVLENIFTWVDREKFCNDVQEEESVLSVCS